MPRYLLMVAMILMPLVTTGCFLGKPGKVLATPLTGVRDVVDVPLVSLSTLFNYWGDQSNPIPTPQPGVSWSPFSGFGAGIGLGLGYYVFKGLTGVIGGVDYVVCRSLYPAYPVGLRPWKKRGQKLGDIYFPNTRALWGKHPPDNIWQIQKAGDPPDEAAPMPATDPPNASKPEDLPPIAAATQ
ncbi:hypothetical protein IT570_14580 [Candidatus Sumerlaeota bacterium]|nr:hypothetical protein [Candidatus Sumerlaeota bacterium]